MRECICLLFGLISINCLDRCQASATRMLDPVLSSSGKTWIMFGVCHLRMRLWSHHDVVRVITALLHRCKHMFVSGAGVQHLRSLCTR
jgi:hypothetical protein